MKSLMRALDADFLKVDGASAFMQGTGARLSILLTAWGSQVESPETSLSCELKCQEGKGTSSGQTELRPTADRVKKQVSP
ncbi:MAG: hypothetical protein HC888_11165 [Candidatus Competibacteraceae bacterium]|nr:hypothetical protein [Candidatus Competibacteraceae bacterium]